MVQLGIDSAAMRWRPRTYFDVLEELLATSTVDGPTVIAIDGRTGSGKSTLARGLAALEPHAVVVKTHGSMCQEHSPSRDDLINQLLIPLRQNQMPQSWTCGARGQTFAIPAGTSTILIDGIGSARREMRQYLNAVVWVHVREDTTRRDVVSDLRAFEDDYLADHKPWEVADLLVSGNLGQPAHDGRYGKVVTAAGSQTGVPRLRQQPSHG
jgi:hypothetical protein